MHHRASPTFADAGQQCILVIVLLWLLHTVTQLLGIYVMVGVSTRGVQLWDPQLPCFDVARCVLRCFWLLVGVIGA